MASFSRYISTLGGFGGPERTEKCSSFRADVYVSACPTSAVAPCSSSSASGFLRVNCTFVGMPLGYLYLYP